ncbi:hypothetical protein [Paractinoplanes hotanensis]|uniref:Uncharacterized protein n=1 Tax=Paractinoplanes hotanensis TaxID=2906497 RepID=A0ABT0YFC7_9ACTN|nr:hypothetical protein [Actinoplanes hotanensis]MCM4084227.1 hypothetical protein [Actinoplanes hotanensis]
MARIRAFQRSTQRLTVHNTTVECEFETVDDGSSRVLHLSTFGSKDRASVRKSSQSIQLDIDHARKLIVILADFLAEAAVASKKDASTDQ